MFRHRCILSLGGFTLIELMVVMAILGILVSAATVSYNHFVVKARAVEGEIVVHEVERLEQVYHASKESYTDSLADLGFNMAGALKYYTPEVRVGYAKDKIRYQVLAVPAMVSETDAWLLTSYRDGSVQVDRVPVRDIQAFATARYLGTTVAMISTGVAPGGGMPGSNEPEWSGGGSSLRCQECGRVVRHDQ